MWAVGGFLCYLAADVAWDAIKERYRGKDPLVQRIADEQKAHFDTLQKTLSSLTIGHPKDVEAIEAARKAFIEIKGSSEEVLGRLALAQQEVIRLTALATGKAGINGGYDFALARNGALRFDPQTHFGVSNIGDGWTQIDITSRDRSKSEFVTLAPGASVPYTNAKSRPCKLGLASINDRPYRAASFVIACE